MPAADHEPARESTGEQHDRRRGRVQPDRRGAAAGVRHAREQPVELAGVRTGGVGAQRLHVHVGQHRRQPAELGQLGDAQFAAGQVRLEVGGGPRSEQPERVRGDVAVIHPVGAHGVASLRSPTP